MPIDRTKANWVTEAAFFDRAVEQRNNKIAPIDPLALARYGVAAPRRRFNKEFRIRTLQGLQGKRVLDLGCGDGSNSVLLAKFGAEVTGIDISSKSIELAQKKATISGVSSAVRFVCSPLENAEVPSNYFDVIWGDAILHHVIDNLELLLQRFISWAKPGALMLFAEPVNFNNTLRQLRFKIPVKTDVTPNERPLERSELAIISRLVPDLHMRCFSLLGRLDRFILVDFNYERSPRLRRILVNAIACVDYALLSLPIIRNMGGTAVFYGHVSKCNDNINPRW